jgi:hypothetical protein
MMSEELANALVEAWHKFLNTWHFHSHSNPLLYEQLRVACGGYIPPAGIRVLLDARNRKASRALWDGKPDDVVVRWLMKSGLPDNLILNMRTHTGARSISHKGAEEAYVKPYRESGRFYNPSNDWKYVKPVRSKKR